MATWQAIVGSTTYSLSDGNPFKIISISGIGNAPVRRLEERGPFQDGSTDTGYRLDPRLINIVLYINASTRALADTYRDTLSGIFNPANGAMVKLRCTRDDNAVRQIDCYAVNLVDMPAEIPDRVLGYQRVGVQLKAPNPIWYNPSGFALAFDRSGTAIDWRYGGGLIGTADLITSGTSVAQGSAFAIPTGLTSYTIFTRTARPASGTEVLWSIKRTADASMDLYFAGTGTTGLRMDAVSDFDYVTTGTAYPAGTASIFFNQHQSVATGEERARMQVVHYTTSSGSLVAQVLDPYHTFGTVSGTVGYWRSTPAAGSAWTPTVTHAAMYSKGLSTAQMDGIVSAITGGTTGNFSGTALIDGTWDEYPMIVLTGPMNDPVLTNTTTGEILSFTGATIPAGAAYLIDTRYGHKTVEDTTGANQIGKLANASDLSTFHLRPGANFLQVSFSGGTTAASQVNLTYYDRYIAL